MRIVLLVCFALFSAAPARAADPQVIRLPGMIDKAYLTRDERTLVAQFDNRLDFVDLATQQKLKSLPLPPLDYNFPAFVSGNHAIFLACDLKLDSDCDRRWSPYALLYDLSKGEKVATFKAEGTEYFGAAEISPDGRYAALLDSQGTLRFIDPKTGATLRTLNDTGLRGGSAPHVALSPDTKLVAYSLLDVAPENWLTSYVRVVDADTGKERAIFRKDTTYSFEFSANNRFLVAGNPKTLDGVTVLTVFDLSTGAVKFETQRAENGLLTPDSRTLYAIGDEGLLAFDLETGRLIGSIADAALRYTLLGELSASGNLLYLRTSYRYKTTLSYVVDLVQRKVVRVLQGTDTPFRGQFIQGEESLLLAAHQTRDGRHHCEITQQSGSTGQELGKLVIQDADGDYNEGCDGPICWSSWRSACSAFQAPLSRSIVAYGTSKGVSQIHLLKELPRSP